MADPKHGSASASDRALSSALIGGSFGFIGIAIFASASYADKVGSNALWWGNLLATFSVLLLIASVVFGGRGWTRKSGAGAFHPFNMQAVTGLIGIVLLCIAAAIFAFNPKQETPKVDPTKGDERLRHLEVEQARQRLQIDLLLKDQKPANVRATATKIQS